jgi:WD40 repeat protein
MSSYGLSLDQSIPVISRFFALFLKGGRLSPFGELWETDLKTGRKQRKLPDFLMEHYNVSPDGRHVVFITADGTGHAPLWVAALDGSSPPRRLVEQDCVRALFAPDGDIFFVGGKAGEMFVQQIKSDGAGLRKVIPERVTFLYSISPDSKWLAVWMGTDLRVYPAAGGSPVVVCTECANAGAEDQGVTPPMLSWSQDARFLYIGTSGMWSEGTGHTYVIPLRPGQILPPLPASGIRLGDMEDSIPGAQAIPQQQAFISPDPSVYAYPRVATHRNIYRIAVP